MGDADPLGGTDASTGAVTPTMGTPVAVVLMVLAVVGGLLFVLGFAVGRSGATPAGAAQLRHGEVAGPAETVVDGPLSFRVLAWRCGMISVPGDHADWLADGQYCRVRVRLTNTDRFAHPYDAAAQQLVAADGRTYGGNLNAISISDQPTRTSVGAFVAMELDIWFDVPEGADIVGVRFSGGEGTPGAPVALR